YPYHRQECGIEFTGFSKTGTNSQEWEYSRHGICFDASVVPGTDFALMDVPGAVERRIYNIVRTHEHTLMPSRKPLQDNGLRRILGNSRKDTGNDTGNGVGKLDRGEGTENARTEGNKRKRTKTERFCPMEWFSSRADAACERAGRQVFNLSF